MSYPSNTNPFEHERAVSICSVCEAPNIPGVACFCVEYTLDDCAVEACPACSSAVGVDGALVSFIDRVLTEPPFAAGPPVPEQRAEEPLPTERPKSWWPVAS